MKFIISESQLQILKEANQENISFFERIANLYLKKKYDWFIKLDIDDMVISSTSPVTKNNRITFDGTVYVDKDLGYEMFRKGWGETQIWDTVEFHAILDEKLIEEIKSMFKLILKTIYPKNSIKYFDFLTLTVQFVDVN